MTDAFFPSRLELARRRRRMKLKDLADKAGLTTSAVSNYERGSRVPPLDVQVKLAAALRFDVSFFQTHDADELAAEAISFRGVSAMSQTLKEAARAAGQIAVEVARFIEERFDLPEVDLPDLHGVEPPLAAEAMRDHFGLDPGPIDNVVERLEAHGVIVFSLAEDTTQVDAFSFWHEGRPFVLLNTLKSPERSRFDAAHELGHLLLHRRQKPQGRLAESEADGFASALLLDESVLDDIPVALNMQTIRRLKHRWRVSCPAFVKRLHTLGRLSDWEYRDFFIQVSAAGGRKTELEPRMIQHERSVVLFEVLKQLVVDGVRTSDIAEALGVSRSDVDGLFFHLAPTAAPLASAVDDDAPVQERPSARILRIVTSN